MGDSITDIWKLDKYFPGKPYINRGIGGQTTPQMLIRFRPDVIDLGPKVVVILAGTNDIAGNTGPMTLAEIEGNLQTMAELARIHGIHVVLSSVLPVNDYTSARRCSSRYGRRRRFSNSIAGSKNMPRKTAASISTISAPWSMTKGC